MDVLPLFGSLFMSFLLLHLHLSEATLADGNYDFLSAFLLSVSPSLKPDLTISLQSSHSFHLSSNLISIRGASSVAGFQILDVKMSLAVTSTHRGLLGNAVQSGLTGLRSAEQEKPSVGV